MDHFNSFEPNIPSFKDGVTAGDFQKRSRSAMWRKASRLRRGWLDVLPAPPREPWVEVEAVLFLAPKNVFWKTQKKKCGGVMCWFGLVTCCEVVSSKKCHVVPANCTFTNDSATPMAYDVDSGRKQLFQPQYIAVRQWECKRCSLLFTDNWTSFWVSRSMHKLWMRICIEHPSAGDIVSVSESERHV